MFNLGALIVRTLREAEKLDELQPPPYQNITSLDHRMDQKMGTMKPGKINQNQAKADQIIFSICVPSNHSRTQRNSILRNWGGK